ncbi:MAG: alpha-D-glucose phosphate-specific phosphoglucomutase [Acidithiobacillus sp.]
MKTVRISAAPYPDQRPGTSGLRKKVTIFQQPAYLELFIEAIFQTIPNRQGGILILGGDGRYFNDHAIQIILRMASAHCFDRVIVGQNGILSTPAISHLIRKRKALGGIILTASHNPGGPEHDFGVKFNVSNGGPAPEPITEQIWSVSKQLSGYEILADTEAMDIDLSKTGIFSLGEMAVEVCSSTSDYIQLMETIFDFDKISLLFKRPEFSIRYDGLHAVTGPYAKALFEDCLGAPSGSVVNFQPLPNFGGGHPDPNLVYGKSLVDSMFAAGAPAFGAASDGDGDRHMILGSHFFVSPCDSLAILLLHANRIPHYRNEVQGVARSMPTSQAVDDIARDTHIPLFETPTGWKFFGDLMDAGKVTFCGEESFGAGSTHIREKDGLWAVLFWLSIIADTGKSVKDLVQDMWHQYGRHYFTRHDFENLDSMTGSAILADLREDVSKLVGQQIANNRIVAADDFSYNDPIDGSIISHQGIRIVFSDHSRIVIRISGTGTEGATLRFYFERVEHQKNKLNEDVQQYLQPFIQYAYALTGILPRSGRSRPNVIT